MSGQRPAGLALGLLVALSVVGLVMVSADPKPPASPTGSSAAIEPTVGASAAATPIATSVTETPLPAETPQPPHATAPASSPSATPTPKGAVQPTPTASPEADSGLVIGTSVQGRPLVAHRIGTGLLKVVLVGDIHGQFEENTHQLAEALAAHFKAHPEEVPAGVSLWIIPTMNPDGLATGHRWNARDVDLNRNADTDLDGCAGNDWSRDTVGHEGEHLGAGGPFPFSEPETRVVRDFLHDAWIAVFYHSAAEAIYADTCRRHAPSAKLAEVLSQATGYEVPEEGWAGYPVTGDMGDYLAGEGVAAVAVELADHADPEFERNLQGVRALLQSAARIAAAEADEVGAEHLWLTTEEGGNVAEWRFGAGSLPHPLDLEILADRAYILEAGRILAIPLDGSGPAELLLGPGDEVEGVRVLEALSLASDGRSLLVLDRAADLYRYDPGQAAWNLERYGRPPGATSDHYFVALATGGQTRYLLETSREQVWRFEAPAGESRESLGTAWAKVPRGRDVDVSAVGDDVYVLARNLNNPVGSLYRYQNGEQDAGFRPNVTIMHPRQVVATRAAVHVLDRAGRRLLTLDRESGALLALRQFTDRRHVTAIWASEADEMGADRLILAGRDTLYFLGEAGLRTGFDSGLAPGGVAVNDPVVLDSLRGLLMPIDGAHLTSRDFQMPGAPRHYRLGVHEGVDFYGNTTGVPVNRLTAVRAVADGTVIRALVDYEPLTATQADDWYNRSRSLGYTPADVLDGYRGRQVWIDHGGGLVSRYAHLGSIEPGIVEGAMVTRGQVIGAVGNSGTPSSVSSDTAEVHLHLELWLGDNYVGRFMRPIETREWLERILR